MFKEFGARFEFGDICQIDGYEEEYFAIVRVCFEPMVDGGMEATYDLVGIDGESMLESVYDEDVILMAKKIDALPFIMQHFANSHPATFGKLDDLESFVQSYVGESSKEEEMQVYRGFGVREEDRNSKHDKCTFSYEENTDGLLDAMNDQKAFVKLTGSESDEINLHIQYLRELLEVES